MKEVRYFYVPNASTDVELPEEEALTHYLRAVCLNRAEKPVEAYTELKQAFSMDPELERTAYTDGDINDLILDKK